MPLTNPNKVVTEERLSEFYGQILPYMGGMPDVLANKFSKGDLYSTDEKMIGCWVDNKPLYQKTVTTGGSVPSGATLIQRTTQTGYDTILYTKTTDSPISIGSDTDYSTTEKIVGTWIDGKPLYQKTINVASSDLVAWVNIYQLPSNCIIQFVLGATHWINADVKVLPMPYFDGSARSTYSFSNNILYMASSNLPAGASYPFKGTLYYTKTTD